MTAITATVSGISTARIIDFGKAREQKKFAKDLAEAKRPRRASKSTKQAAKLQAVRLAARQAI